MEKGVFVFQPSVFVIRLPTVKDSDMLLGSEYKREIYNSQAADDNSIFVL